MEVDKKEDCLDPVSPDWGYMKDLLESGDLEDDNSKCDVAVGQEKFTHNARI